MARYRQRFVQDFEKIASPLTMLTRNGVEYIWMEEHNKIFKELKWRLIIVPKLEIPNNSGVVEVYSDASS